NGASLTVDSTWRLITVQHTVSSGVTSLGVFYEVASGGTGTCFLFDDASMARIDGAPTNNAPTASARPDQTTTLAAGASLDGTITDDGQPNPPGVTTASWTKVSGPGTVTFGNASAVDTTATFSATGTYVLRLTASDSVLSTSDDIQITVNPNSVITWY